MKSYLFNVHDVILIMTVSQCLLLALFQSMMPTFNRTSHILISVFFLLTALGCVTILLFWNEKFQAFGMRSGYGLPIWMSIAFLLCGPALYLYFNSITNSKFKLLNLYHAWHLLPLVVVVAVIFSFGVSGHDLYHVDGVWLNRATLFIWTSFKVSPVIYALVCVYILRNIGDSLMNHFSDGGKVGGMWAKTLVYSFVVYYAYSFFIHVLGNIWGLQISDSFGIMGNYLTFVLVNSLFVYSLLYSQHLAAASISSAVVQEVVDAAEGEEAGDILPEGVPSDGDVAAVLRGVKEQKLYLEHNITVEQFAQRVGLSSRDASHIINSYFKSNFFEFINSYRVEEAKSILASPEHRRDTVLDILHMSGFNSKSAFHRFFKRMTGVSPTQYRKEHLH